MTKETIKAIGWGTLVTLSLAVLIIVGSRNLSQVVIGFEPLPLHLRARQAQKERTALRKR